MSLPPPIVEQHAGISVVRDDLLPGGTKARYLLGVFEGRREVVYASPAYGGAQLALAYCARSTGKAATIFVAKRSAPHARTLEAKRVGARVFQVPFGRLNVVQSRAKAYARDKGAYLLPWGGDLPGCVEAIAAAAAAVDEAHGPFEEVWSAAGSGVLTRGLQAGIRSARRFFAVQVGANVKKPGKATVVRQPLEFGEECERSAPFPSCRNYDCKAWAALMDRRSSSTGPVLFWNVLGPSPTPHGGG